MNRALLVSLKVIVVGLLIIVLTASDNLSLLVGGSDSTSLLLLPPLWVQCFGVLLPAIALFAPASRGVRSALSLLAVIAIVFATHRVVIDNLNGRIADIYLALPFQMISVKPEREEGIEIHSAPGGFLIGPAGQPSRLRILSPPFFGLDTQVLARTSSS